ncbi:biotin--[acetyl-CoA-carboxylase] ligase [Humidisolicoccus flavus]|uniref:biotin--[acetyl-CoA-carboxylase] ligase n=1 Tax=Humidisolicoccus flavus TaxID=3111414 RepID=UPI0032434720
MRFPQSATVAPVHDFDSVGSTNDVLAAGVAPWTTAVTLDQTSGRGRLGRVWTAPRGKTLAASVSVPIPPHEVLGWLPLLVGLSVANAVEPFVARRPMVKWPNDVLIAEKKVSGILCELRADAVVVGFGVNLSLAQHELPVETATSIALEASDAAVTNGQAAVEALADEILHRVLVTLQRDVPNLADGAVHRAITERCGTLGKHVRLLRPDGQTSTGLATRIAENGELVVETEQGPTRVAAGDVTHVR